MCSYNAAYGKPTCADDTANNQLARGQWGFKGFFVSDCTALELMQDAKWDNCPHPWPSEGVSWRLQLLLYGPNDFHRPNAQLPLTHFVVCVLSLLTSLLRAIVLRIRSPVVTTTRSLSVIRCMRCVENLVQDCVESVCVCLFFATSWRVTYCCCVVLTFKFSPWLKVEWITIVVRCTRQTCSTRSRTDLLESTALCWTPQFGEFTGQCLRFAKK